MTTKFGSYKTCNENIAYYLEVSGDSIDMKYHNALNMLVENSNLYDDREFTWVNTHLNYWYEESKHLLDLIGRISG